MSDLSLDQQPEGWTHAAQAYDTMAAPFTALFAQDALRLANVQPGQRVLDVAAGTGALSFAAVERGAEDLATDFAPGMVEHLRAKVATQGVHGMQVAIMDGQALEVEDNSFDAAFSILGLIYFPDRAAGFRELSRALRPGGRAVVVGWSTIERLRFIQAILGALREAVPDVPPPPKPPPWLSLADRTVFKSEMHTGGFAQVTVFTVAHIWMFPSPEAFFDALPNVAPGFRIILGPLQPHQRTASRTAFVRCIREEQGDGPFGLEGEAHIAVGRK
jgi:SAM-dependent methyltransferase